MVRSTRSGFVSCLLLNYSYYDCVWFVQMDWMVCGLYSAAPAGVERDTPA